MLLDAISWRIPLVSDIPTIIFGADVTHPETGEDSSPSIAAVRLITTLPFPHQNVIFIRMHTYLSWFRTSLYFFNMLLTGCCFSRLARSYKVCWIGLCSGTPARAHSGPLQNMARSSERHCNRRHDQVFIYGQCEILKRNIII